MTTTVTLDDVPFTDTMFENFGYLTPTTVGGTDYPAWQALWVAGLNQLSTNVGTTAAALVGTSTTSLTVGTGAQALTLAATGKSFAVGEWVMVYETSAPTNWMVGIVSVWADPNLTVIVTRTGGSGSHSDWTVALTGVPGAQWSTGAGAPSDANGNDGDFYLRSTGLVYQKAAGAWASTGITLIGPAGADGANKICDGGVAGGTANALTCTAVPAPAALARGLTIGLRTGAAANSGAATLNPNGLGATAIQKNGAALVGGELAASTDYTFRHDGTAFQLMGGASGSGTSNWNDDEAFAMTFAMF